MSEYRSDVEQLRSRLEAVREELIEVRQKLPGYDELRRREGELEREAAALSRELGAKQRRTSLPLLDRVKIASPCDADWDQMAGDERRRFCAQCEKPVYNLSAMKRDEAERFLEEAEGKACVRLFRRADGTVLTADCPVGVRRRRRRYVAVTALALGALGAAAFFTIGRATQGEPAAVAGTMVVEPASTLTGEMEIETPPAVSASAAPRSPPPSHQVVQGGVSAPRTPQPRTAPSAYLPRGNTGPVRDPGDLRVLMGK